MAIPIAFIHLLDPAVASTACEQTHRKERWDAVEPADLNTKEVSVFATLPPKYKRRQRGFGLKNIFITMGSPSTLTNDEQNSLI